MSRMFKYLFGKLALNLSESGRDAIRSLGYLLRRKPGLVGFMMACNLLGAVLEGGSMGLLGVAVSVLLGEGDMLSSGLLSKLNIFIGPMIDRYGEGGSFLILVGIAVSSQVVRVVFLYGATATEIILAVFVRRETQRKVTRHLMEMSYETVMRQPAGAPANAIDQAQTVSTLVRQIGGAARATCMLIAYIVLILVMSPLMALVTVGIAWVIWWIMGLVAHRLRVLSDLSLKGREKTFFWTWEFINAPRLLRVFNSTEYATELINSSRDDQIFPERRSTLIQASINPAMEILTISSAGLVLIAGYLFAGDTAKAAIPTIFVYVLVFYRLKPNLQFFNNLRVQLGWLLPHLEMVQDFLNEGSDRTNRQSKSHPVILKSEIKFDNVGFRYPGTYENVLHALNFSIEKGSTVAFVGPSGAGKSTTMDLLLGLYQPSSGSIVVDGVDMRDMDDVLWREKIGLVEQDIFLLNSTVSANIAFAREEATEVEIMRAADAAHASEFINQLPKGLETVIGDRGHKLSGGQRQRLALARALLRSPDVLLLDEATSSLDSVSEKQIRAAIEAMHHERTIVIIAHRLSTIEKADNIVVFDKGGIVEQGTISELLAKQGQFWRLWESQNLEI